jgi:tripartite-type tricarboxylate transporter receptor subunit TctC
MHRSKGKLLFMIKQLVITAAILFLPISGNCGQSGSTLDPQYFKGKSVRVVVNYEPGSSADLFGRLIVKHLPAFLPGSPRMVVVNRSGASGTVGANYLYSARGDGLTIGMFSALYPSNQMTLPDVPIQYAEIPAAGNSPGQKSALVHPRQRSL